MVATVDATALFEEAASEDLTEAVLITVAPGGKMVLRALDGMTNERVFYLLNVASHDCMSAATEAFDERELN
jgi:hypothetical protein